VIEASGAISAFSEGLQMVARNGRYLLVGLWAGSDDVAIDPSYILNRNLRVIGSAHRLLRGCSADPASAFPAANRGCRDPAICIGRRHECI
jgi:threonine dehydrogenase-like Zn-dependent dehydrogenase